MACWKWKWDRSLFCWLERKFFLASSDIKGEKGFIADEIKRLDAAVVSAFDIAFVFNKYTLGEECLQRLGFGPEEYNDFDWNLLEALGFSEGEIEAANDFICGTMMLEGAPALKEEHLPVFDCAN